MIRRARPEQGRAVDAPLPVPGWWRHPLTRAAVFLIASAAAAAVLGAVWSANTGLPRWGYPALQLVGSIAGYLVVAVVVEGRCPPAELAPRRAGGLLVGAAVGAVACLLVFGLCWVLGARRLLGTNPSAPLLAPLFSYGVVAAVSEELVFRGMLFRLVESVTGTRLAVLASGAAFGALHLANPAATAWGATAIALEAGVALALLYALTRSLWLVIGIHGAWNVVEGPLLGSAISGATANGDGLLVSQPAGPVWLSGGGFGLEASAASLLVWGCVSAWAALRLVRRPDGR